MSIFSAAKLLDQRHPSAKRRKYEERLDYFLIDLTASSVDKARLQREKVPGQPHLMMPPAAAFTFITNGSTALYHAAEAPTKTTDTTTISTPS